MTTIFYKPDRQAVQGLQVGDDALDCFGYWRKVVEIYGRDDDVNGRAYVCFYTEFGPRSRISGSYKEGELVRTTALSVRYKSAELDRAEREMVVALDTRPPWEAHPEPAVAAE